MLAIDWFFQIVIPKDAWVYFLKASTFTCCFSNSLMVVATIMRKVGSDLLDHIEQNPNCSHTENATACGYVREDGKIAFTDYFEAVCEARKDADKLTDDSEFDEWYESLDSDTTLLWDAIYERVSEECDIWDLQQCKDFIAELSDYGIETAEQFEDSFQMYDSGYDVEARFAEQYYTDCGIVDEDNPVFFAIDWDIVWRHSLSYDFMTFEFNGETWFFHNNFWSSY